ncbi:MAG: hypothetical protein QOE76_268 [Frankiales bacterium]|jgi:hypothetical protein|nr:hypothetical protein [Frankiales bacterium]
MSSSRCDETTDLVASDFYGSLDLFGAPLTVEETLLEITLAGPGPDAIRLLETLQDRAMTSAERLRVAGAWERQARWMSARQHAANVAFVGVSADDSTDGLRREAALMFELALQVDCGDTFLKYKLGNARLLATTLSATAAKLESGELSDYRARLICDRLGGLAPVVARQIEAKVLPTAGEVRISSLTAKLRRLTLAAQGAEAAEQHLQGAANRRVSVDREPAEPGLLGLHAYLPPETTVAVREALEAKAAEFAKADKAMRAKNGTRRRTKDQRLADALAWFVLGSDEDDDSKPARPKILVQVTMSLPTLLALRDNSGELPGYGPIPAEIARRLAEDADWQRFIHEPVTGYLLDYGNQRYRQPDDLRRFTKARDVKDRFPGSNRSARFGDGDHVQPYEEGRGGNTSAANVALLSRIGHVAKTHGGWSCVGDANEVLTWTSPHGQVYRSAPHDYRDDEQDHAPEMPPPF